MAGSPEAEAQELAALKAAAFQERMRRDIAEARGLTARPAIGFQRKFGFMNTSGAQVGPPEQDSALEQTRRTQQNRLNNRLVIGWALVFVGIFVYLKRTVPAYDQSIYAIGTHPPPPSAPPF